MERAIALAWKGWGRVGSNPLVGALVLRGGEVVGEGFHAEFGGPHGEVAALQAAGERAAGGDLVVTLEPCAHHGKTPPCTDAILEAGIRRVVFAAADADPRAQGGAEVLRRAGIAAMNGPLEDAVRAQNALFFHRHSGCGRPFVALKLAISLDGRIADASGASSWVTGEEARDFVQWLRAGFDAIAVGAGTALRDDPQLTVRGSVTPLEPPLRIVFDRRAEIRSDAVLVRSARETPTLVIVGKDAAAAEVRRLEGQGVQTVVADDPAEALGALHARGIASLLVEGGGVLSGRLLGAELIDRLYLIAAPTFLGDRGVSAFRGVPDVAIEAARRWRTVERRALGGDSLLVLDRP